MRKENKTSLSDVPFEGDVDDFKTERYVKGLVRFINNSAAPITIALQGEWGSGKTSLMKHLRKALCEKPGSPFLPVEINTWEYSMLSTPEDTVYRIIEQLVQALSDGDPKPRNTFEKLVKGARGALYRGVREYIKQSKVAAVVTETLDVPTDWIDSAPEQRASLADLKNALQNAVAEKCVAGIKGVIVFVDDLDRLNPPVAVEILELLKNIFCIDNCIFILAIDYDVVVKGLEPKFGKLTDSNEREFRSFFDKIIQVPFSLPVNSYQPMGFVFDSLVNIEYLTPVEARNQPDTQRTFAQIVEKSVGKNPRSIKRLINTLSLLCCISREGEEPDAEFVESLYGRTINFIIVALQVCYPRISRMLTRSADFTKWDAAFASKFNIRFDDDELGRIGWEDVLKSACDSDPYHSEHFTDILALLHMIQETVRKNNPADENNIGNIIRLLMNKVSVTDVTAGNQVAEVDRAQLVARIHRGVTERIKRTRPDIPYVYEKRITGNGGFFIGLPDDDRAEIILRPTVTDSTISCEMILSTQIQRPERMLGMTFAEMCAEPAVAKAIAALDKVIVPLLRDDIPYFKGRSYNEGNESYLFRSFAEEQAYRCDKGWHDNDITQRVSYWIELNDEELFGDKAIIKIFTDIVGALYDMRVAAAEI